MVSPRFIRLRRARVRRGLVALGLLALATTTLTILATNDDPSTRTPAGAPPTSTSLAPPGAPEPPPGPTGRGPPPAGLSPLALHWREAIVGNRRTEVLSDVQALRRAPDQREQLARLMTDPHDRVRAYALRELGRLRDPALGPTFQTALTDPAAPVRENARWALDELAR